MYLFLKAVLPDPCFSHFRDRFLIVFEDLSISQLRMILMYVRESEDGRSSGSGGDFLQE